MRVRERGRWRAAAVCSAAVIASSVTGGSGGAAASPPPENRPSQAALAAEALRGAVRTADPQALGAVLGQAHRAVADRAAQAPSQFGSASVVFDEGMTSGDLADLAAKNGLDVYAAEAKVSVPSSDEVHTMWFNDVARVVGTRAEKLDRSTGAARLRYLQQAEAAPAAHRAALLELAAGDYDFYRAELVGTNAALAALVGAPSVRAVLPDADDGKVAALRAAQAEARAVEAAAPGEVRLTGLPVTTGRGTPVITTAGRRCAWEAAGVLACQRADGTVSGDASVDAALPRTGDSVVAGSDKSAPSGTEVRTQDDASLWTGCNNGSDGQACPNDNTYRPHPDTGGAQAFGVSVTNYSANQVIYICYAEWVWDPEVEGTGGYWVYYCYPYAVVTEAFTFGAARWDSRWGTRVTTVAASGQTRPISTLAYKFVDGLQPCVVQQSFATAECSRALSNSVWVPRTGLEDELLIGNPACGPTPILGRAGTEEDRRKGCFFPNYATTTLPAPFLDTTFGDGQAYNLAIGSANPGALAEGTTYSSYAEFWAYGNNNMIGQTAFHAVAVDSRVDEAAICIAKSGANPFCYFPVDSSRVSAILPFT